ncbi:AAA domain-containing protein [Dyadobacter sp. CY261]|uniref:AAA domain-containing protein n=1 Tax=Dyadobacter sp. CY261 TaxID=2907203 RepID=UPI001F3212D3|nr:AAA domain-containing protein [Dyadobacter sp. CY261]MCF0075248.1 AAA domain-containing protein [Dyadobacter sp. CY261]
MNRILKAYLKRLTNLSTRNKSLLLTNLSAEQFLDFHDIDFLLSKPSIEVLQQVIQGKGRVALCDVADPRFEKVNEVSKRLRKISRTERFIEEERGSRDLYVGYPFIKGKLSDGTPIHAPLLFFPVTLRMDREQWCLLERDDSIVALNQSFALAYGHFNEAKIPDEVLEKSFEDFPEDFLEFRTQLYEWLKSTPFKINFNQQLFEDKLIAFDAGKASELVTNERNGELKLYPEAVLGIFPQAGSYLVPDYNRLIDLADKEHFSIPLIGSEEAEGEVEGQTEPVPTSENRQMREEDVLTPFAIDESQEEIILAVKSGRSVVVQGPPGSGKSQLICNLIADFASRGKRVLLVCQKRAALDVVYQRLTTTGMKDFTGLIHDFKNDRSALYMQIAAQIEKVDAYRQQNYSLDSVFLERQFTQESRAIDKTVSELDNFRLALFDENECGVSIKELYLTSDPQKPHADTRQYYRQFRIDGWDGFKRHLKTYFDYAFLIRPGHPWHQRRSFASFGVGELRTMENMLLEWPAAFEKQLRAFEKLTGLQFNKEYISQRHEIVERLTHIEELVMDEASWKLLKKYTGSGPNPHERLALARQAVDTMEGFLAEGGIEMSLPAQQLNAFEITLKKSLETKQSAVSGFFWDVFSKEKREIERVANNNGLTIKLEDLTRLEERIRNRRQLESWLQNTSLGFEPGFIDDFSADRAGEYLLFFRSAERAADATARMDMRMWRGVFHEIVRVNDHLGQFKNIIQNLKQWLQVWDRMEKAMLPYLLPAQITALIDEPAGYSRTLLEALRNDFDSLADMDRLWEGMTKVEQDTARAILDKAVELALPDANAALELFENSIKLAWIEHVESKYPALRSVTSLKMKQWEDQMQGSIALKQKLSSDIANIKLREATYEDVEKNRLGNRVTYRELGHQVTKKRKIWPVRKMFEHYADEVFALIPCWMASPEAVSAIFPMEKGLFDLVIFDEASQCYAEYSLPAAFRGKQWVVTGDSKQLSPSDLYRVRFEDRTEDEEYSAAIEIESLLDLAGQSLDHYQLTGHYRSLSLDLIDFSNRKFYKQSLKLLPDFNKINDREPGIQYIKTDGVWKNNTNPIEVEEVLRLVRELGSSGRSMGVVTFNFYQQAAIQDALEREIAVPEGLFVKNIENVQGDERDVIIFSMGYAPDEKGRISMQFGTLNMQGGENRLNVAVTRAREKIYFVTSLWPSQLQTEHTANEGPKLLKAYMDYALQVSEGRFEPAPLTTGQFRSDWLLKERLVKQNPAFEKELPFGDITVKEEGAYKGLVLTDDDLYHYSKSSKEPHAYLPLLLRLKNWPFRRVYSREYWSGNLKNGLL